MWGQGAQGGFQNALATGLQLGGMVRQQTDARNERNALAAFVQDPNKQTAAAVAPYQPKLVLDYNASEAERQAKAAEADLTRRAMGGDDEALGQLATVNFDRWKALDAQQKASASEKSQVFGNAAIDLLNMPYEGRRGPIIAFSLRFPDLAEQINGVAYLPQAEQDAALRAIVAEAKLTEKLIAMERPDYQAIPEGGTLVNTRDPQAVGEFQSGGGGQPVSKSIGGVTYYQNPRTGQWFDNPQEAMGAR